MRQPIVKDLRSKTKAKVFIKCPRGASRRLEAKAMASRTSLLDSSGQSSILKVSKYVCKYVL